MAEATHGVVVRAIQEGEKAEVQRIMRRAFAISAWLFFSWSKDVLVAEVDGRIVGGAVLQILTPDKRRKVGSSPGSLPILMPEGSALARH